MHSRAHQTQSACVFVCVERVVRQSGHIPGICCAAAARWAREHTHTHTQSALISSRFLDSVRCGLAHVYVCVCVRTRTLADDVINVFPEHNLSIRYGCALNGGGGDDDDGRALALECVPVHLRPAFIVCVRCVLLGPSCD